MINMETQEIVQGGKTERIKEWVVWFICPCGVSPEVNEVIDLCKTLDMDPRLNVMPVSMAKGETLTEIVGVAR